MFNADTRRHFRREKSETDSFLKGKTQLSTNWSSDLETTKEKDPREFGFISRSFALSAALGWSR